MLKKRKYSRVNIDKFEEEYGELLGPYVSQICKMQLLKHKLKTMRYTKKQIWIGAYMLIGSTILGYKVLRQMMHLPSFSTIRRYLENFHTYPGINAKSANHLKRKVNPSTESDKWCFILLDEMNLRTGMSFHELSGSILGFEDDGTTKSSKLASSVIVFMVVGVFKRYKHPIGYVFTSSVTTSSKIQQLIYEAIEVTEREGFIIKGTTSDQGSNIEKCFRLMGVKPEQPFFYYRDMRYFVYKDPPHLLKCARNFLESNPVHVPECSGQARWSHIEQLQCKDSVHSLKLVPKLTLHHVHGLHHGSRMKVNLAVQVLSHSVSAVLHYLVSKAELDAEALSTASYCEWLNNIFDCLNSLSSKDRVIFRKPINVENQSTFQYLEKAKNWLQRLDLLNKDRKSRFIKGFIQSINVVLLLSQDIRDEGFKYFPHEKLNTRFLGKLLWKDQTKALESHTSSIYTGLL